MQQGHEVIGVTLNMHGPGEAGPGGGTLSEAAESARALGIAHFVVDIRELFSREIMAPFCREYLRGRTPNPCVRCDALVKFPALASFAAKQGCGAWATGHYAMIKKAPGGRLYVSPAAERARDQSYFLFMLSQQSMDGLLFPLGMMTKDQARDMVAARGIACARRPDSQEICFVPDQDYARFIEEFTGSTPPPGEIVDRNGRVLGTHRGIHRHTIGQRRGMGIAAPRPLYVTGIDAGANRIIAGEKEELLSRGLVAVDICFMKEESLDSLAVAMKIRSTQAPFEAVLSKDGHSIIATFREPQSQITPGQAAVFYDSEGGVLGGGIIDRAL
jgi:tRNA-specific 2-thiouridylase